MVIFKPMVLVGMFLILIGIYGVWGTAEKPSVNTFLSDPRGVTSRLMLSKVGQGPYRRHNRACHRRDYGHCWGNWLVHIKK